MMWRSGLGMTASIALLGACASYHDTERIVYTPAPPAITASAPGTIGVPPGLEPIPPAPPGTIPSAPGTIGVPAGIPGVAGTAERLTPSGERPGIRSSMARSADALFFAQAAHGSTGEIRLSRMALDKSSDPAVKEFARQMIDDHVQLNAQLAELAEREGQGLPSRPTNHMEQLAQRFARESGDRFDRDYMAQMVNDHIRTLSMFDQAARTASDPSVRAFAESKVPELQAHLQKAQELNEALGSTAGK